MTNWSAKALLGELDERLGDNWRAQFETVMVKNLPTGTAAVFADDLAFLQDIEGVLVAIRFRDPRPEFAKVGPNKTLRWEAYTVKRRLGSSRMPAYT